MRERWLAGGSFVVAAMTAASCAGSASTDDVPSRVAPSPEPTTGTAAQCGSMPTSTGPLATVAHLAINAPNSAPAGQAVPVSVTVTSRSAVPRVITVPGSSAVLVLQDNRVVGRAVGTARALRVPLSLTGGATQPAQAVPKSISLISCESTARDALVAGDYALVAVLGYQLDSLNAAPIGELASPPTGQRSFALVSAAVSITIG